MRIVYRFLLLLLCLFVFTVSVNAAPTPQWKNVTVDDDNTVVLEWEPIPNVTAYTIYYARENDIDRSMVLASFDSDTTSYSYPLRYEGEILFYWLVAEADGEITSFSEPRSTVRILDVTPWAAEPYLLGNDAVRLRWHDVTGEENYELYRSEENNPAEAQRIARTDSGMTNFIDETIKPGKTYYYWIVAVNPAGSSPFDEAAVLAVPEPESSAYFISELGGGDIASFYFGVTQKRLRLWLGGGYTSAKVELINKEFRATAFSVYVVAGWHVFSVKDFYFDAALKPGVNFISVEDYRATVISTSVNLISSWNNRLFLDTALVFSFGSTGTKAIVQFGLGYMLRLNTSM